MNKIRKAAFVIGAIALFGGTITTIAETVVCIGYKIVRLSDIQGPNTIEGLPVSGKPQKFIVATNLLNI